MNSPDTLNFDHQASTPVDDRVLKKMLQYFTHKSGNPHSSNHAIGWESARVLSESAQSIARMVGADEDEIIFTSGASESVNLALLGLGKRSTKGKRRRILVSAIEHRCVLEVARVLKEQFGYCVEQIPVDANGHVQVSELSDRLDEDVLAVSVMAVNNEIGSIQDLESLSEAIHNVGAVFHSDAAQAPIAMNLKDVAGHVDLLSLSGHKMYGPQGVGVLYICRELQDKIEPLIYGGGQQNGLRSGTVPVPLCVGMAAASDLLSSPEGEEAKLVLRERRDQFVQALLSSKWEISLNGSPTKERHPGNANICFHGFSASEVLNTFQPKLAASAGSACATGIPEPSHVLKAIGLSSDNADASIRFSLGIGVSEQEVIKAVEIIERSLNGLSSALGHSA